MPAEPGTDIASRPAEIRVLPPLVVNQIAAGEVVERPASVVKELVDNAIDAGATRILCELEQGGVELVRVTDDGRGIPREQLPLAIHPHATSKINAAEDLDAIATMGFRGEALASIASVSRLSIRSRTHDADEAWRLDIEGDQVAEPRPDGGPVGTTVSVRNLFFNTPARRKFLRTPNTEQGHATDIVRNLAMAHPAIGFTLRTDGRTIFDLPADQAPRQRILELAGAADDAWFVVQADRFDDPRGVNMWGLAGQPSIARATQKAQHVFLNGRPIRDKTITHALREAYRGLIEPGRHPAAVLLIDIAPDAVDVNVHPAKTEVRFRDAGVVHKTVYQTVRAALMRQDLTPIAEYDAGGGGARPGGGGGGGAAGGGGLRFEPATHANPDAAADATRRRFDDFFNRFVPDKRQAGFDYESLRAAVEAERDAVARERAELERQRVEADTGDMRAARRPDIPGQAALPAARPASRALQVHNSYLVTQDEHGIVIIDQHALHERVMFQKLRERLGAGDLESQRLLVPDVVETTRQRVDLVDALRPLLTRLGVAAEGLGPETVGVHAFPTFLFDKGVEPGPFVSELLERADNEPLPVDEEDALHEILDMMACKAAVKAGDGLSDAEIDELLRLRASVERASNCPHGRPTAIRLSMRDLEKQFGRR